MGYWHWSRIKQWTNVTDSDTQRLSLAENATISALRIMCETKVDDTARTAATVCARPWDDIDNLNVKGDQEDVIKNISGRECLGLNYYDFKSPPAWQVGDDRDGTQIVYYYLNFGRSPGDPIHALDTSKWGEVTLEIEHSFTTTDKVGFQTGTSDFDVWQLRRIGDMPQGNQGYFKTSRKYKWTGSATAGEWQETLPIRNPYRRIAIFSHEDLYTPGDGIQDITLKLNDGALSPFFARPYQLCPELNRLYNINPTFRYTASAYNGATDALMETEVPYLQSCVVVPRTASGASAMAVESVAGSIVGLSQTGAGDGFATVTGDGFMGCLLIPFDLSGEDDYLPSADYDKVELVIDEKVTRVPAMSVVLDELIA